MTGAPHALEVVVVVDVSKSLTDPSPWLKVAKPDKLVEEEAVAATVELDAVDASTEAAYVCLNDGGIMAGVSSLGRGFPLTFSATRNIASANCSALRRPVLDMSQRFLDKLKQTSHPHTHTQTDAVMLWGYSIMSKVPLPLYN